MTGTSHPDHAASLRQRLENIELQQEDFAESLPTTRSLTTRTPSRSSSPFLPPRNNHQHQHQHQHPQYHHPYQYDDYDRLEDEIGSSSSSSSSSSSAAHNDPSQPLAAPSSHTQSQLPGQVAVAAHPADSSSSPTTLSPTSGAPRVRFSLDETVIARAGPRSSWASGYARAPRPGSPSRTQLYTIESHADDMRAHEDRHGESSEPAQRGRKGQGGQGGQDTPEQSKQNRYSRGSGADGADEPISLTRSRRRFGGFDNGLKNAVASATEGNPTLQHYREWAGRQRQRQKRWMGGPLGRMKQNTHALYKRYIIEGLLGRKPIPPSKDGRHIPLRPGWVRHKPLKDERTGKPYRPNFIRSSRYTVYDFLPKQLVFQFGKLANFYFLIIGVMQMIPGLSTTGSYTTIAPLLAFVAISMAKEGYDDYRRYRLDKQENKSTTWVLDPDGGAGNGAKKRKAGGGFLSFSPQGVFRKRSADDGLEMGMAEEFGGRAGGRAANTRQDKESGPWSKVAWQDVRVGDVVRLQRDENVPADMVLLDATGPNGVAYIETMALDGETNLKSKQACPLLAEHCGSVESMTACNAEIVSEDPNLDLYNYEGRVSVGNGEMTPLTTTQVVYRGSTLRNTNQALGLVINTGEECKIRMNAHKDVKAKAPEMQFLVNRIVVLLVIFVVCLSVGCTVGNLIWTARYFHHAWYLQKGLVSFKEVLIGFIIEYNTLIPLSLYVSLEIIKLGQLLLLQDVEMYDPVTDTPMVANTTTILENLGQVSYVFSDKTGTLTENLMRFRKLSVAGTAWLHDADIRKEAEEAERKRRTTPERKTRRKPPKAGGSQACSVSTVRQPMLPEDGEMTDQPLMDETRIPSASESAAPVPPRRMSSSGASQWQSTALPANAQPELNTQGLISYIRHRPRSPFSVKARHFLLCMALCHSCLPETDERGNISFQAASPDELALVEAAKDLGVLVVDRPAQSIKLQFLGADGASVTETYEVLDTIEFSSKRKRMSIIIRMPDGKLCIFVKGADSMILPRLKQNFLAVQKARDIERRATIRKSMEQERALQRRSEHSLRRESLNLVRAASTMSHRRIGLSSWQERRNGGGGQGSGGGLGGGSGGRRRSATARRSSTMVSNEVDYWLTRRETQEMDAPAAMAVDDEDADDLRLGAGAADGTVRDGMATVDEALAVDDAAVFERCFQHIEDFASEGLRTLIFAYRYLEEDDYRKWKAVYHEASTSLERRQERIEEAAELIEQDFDLAGATAIEDKLQQGVPETIDKLRRANVRVWMLTGDKRETAINIAHSARICKAYSEVYVLDAAEGNLQGRIASTLVEVGRGMVPHSVVVIDGHTLGIVDEDEALRSLLFDLAALVDSVICCRASPAQKAALVRCVRQRVPKAVTLAIGDGANDIAMIQASHVGVGISGREGLQAARIADFSIAQFRFLQRLLFVHGRWNYLRTGKYILGTFWKELVFYLVQAQYQKYNGYTGTSLYESTSLTVFNTLFTSLPVILLGIFEKDLAAETLLAVPELYTFGQEGRGFNFFPKYVAWMCLAVLEATIIFNSIYTVYDSATYFVDTGLYAVGTLAFTVCVVFINLKILVLQMHNRTFVSFLGLFISVSGWFVWDIFLGAIYKKGPGPYMVYGDFTREFGRSAVWWLTGLGILAAVVTLESAASAARRFFFPTDEDLMQEIEKMPGVMAVMSEHASERTEFVGPVTGKFPGGDGGTASSSSAFVMGEREDVEAASGVENVVMVVGGGGGSGSGGHGKQHLTLSTGGFSVAQGTRVTESPVEMGEEGME